MHRPRTYLLVASLLLGTLLCGSLTGLSPARSATTDEIGILPPANPRADCGGWALPAVDACRAHEGIGRLDLPTNWGRLSTDAKLLVLIDLERVNRGLAPITVLLTPLNALAQQGAERRTDPRFPAVSCHCFSRAGGIFASSDPPSVLEADELWMYDDASSDWGHRDNILMAGKNLVGGAGATDDTWDFEMVAGYRARASQVTFRWSQELKYFTRHPIREPLRSAG